MVNYRHGDRESISRESINSLLQNTTYPYEFILVDNTENNRGLGKARNIGLGLSSGSYVAIVDDDIYFEPYWLEECIKMVNIGDRFLATPVHQHHISKWETGMVKGYRNNYRTGSNCMVMRREVIDEVGLFITLANPKRETAKTGKNFATRLSRAGYSFLITKEPMARDMARGVHSYYAT